jgi:hypothetical protein
MRMPGFTAEASLSATKWHYQVASSPTALTDGGIVLPQFCYTNQAGVTTCCDCYYGYCWCRRIVRILLE